MLTLSEWLRLKGQQQGILGWVRLLSPILGIFLVAIIAVFAKQATMLSMLSYLPLIVSIEIIVILLSYYYTYIKKEISEKKILNDYNFIELTGISVHKRTKQKVCTKCLYTALRASPLRNATKSKFACSVCDQPYDENIQNVIFLPQKKDSVLENYDKHENGYFIHKKTKKPFCPTCLAAPKYYENELTIKDDNYWCESSSCNYHKPVNPSDFYPDKDSGESPLNIQF